MEAKTRMDQRVANTGSFDWPPGTDEILLEGLSHQPTAYDLARERMRKLHPRLKPQAIVKRLQGKAREQEMPWTSAAFWKQEIDCSLTGGILGGTLGREAVLRTIASLWPDLELQSLRRRLEALADHGTPVWAKAEFWIGALNEILIDGVRGGVEKERRAVGKILRLYPEIRQGVVMAQLRRVRAELHRSQGRQRHRFPWTGDLLRQLKDSCSEAGVSAAVTQMQEKTGWPRDAILRRVHLILQIPSKSKSSTVWSASERRYIIEHAGHLSAVVMAKELNRSVESVVCKMKHLGLSTARDEGFTVSKLAAEWHVRRATISQWIRAGWMKRGKDGRVPERSVRSFCRQHKNELNWERMEPYTRAWVLEFAGGPEETEEDEAAGAVSGSSLAD
jgi:hypothetical protein